MRALLARLSRLAGPPRRSENGAALLAALFIVSLMAAAGAAAMEEIRYAVRRAGNIAAQDQAYWYALGAEALAGARLRAAGAGDGRTLLERAAAEGRTLAYPIEGGALAAQLTEAQNCFNLNALAPGGENGAAGAAAARAEFERLLNHLDIGAGRAGRLAASLADWIDPDSRAQSGGAEDGAYLGASVPHRAANAPLVEPGELRAIQGYDEAAVQRLAPFVCVWPDAAPARLNVNTLLPRHAPLLAALFGSELTVQEAEDVIAARPAAGYAETGEFLAHPRIAEIEYGEDIPGRLGLVSQGFVLTTRVAYLDAELTLESRILAPPGARPRVVSRRFGEGP